MKKNLLTILSAGLVFLGTVGNASAAIIDFTGGTAYLSGGGTVVTTNSTTYTNVDYYVEEGFKLDFIGGLGIIGNYYGGGNDVIHGHWDTGWYGTLTEIKVTKVDDDTFDLNYFELTSNTDRGGTVASGNELAYITGYSAGGTLTGSQLLPADNWGWSGPNPQIYLGSAFDDIASFSFTVANKVDCFGMDSFYINEPAPPPVPEPSTVILLGGGLAGLAFWRKRKRA